VVQLSAAKNCPSYTKEMGGPSRDGETRDRLAHRVINKTLASNHGMLRQNATVCGAATIGDSSRHSAKELAAQPRAIWQQRRVVEHKGIVRREVGFGDLFRGC
jgi:hypothetical protein